MKIKKIKITFGAVDFDNNEYVVHAENVAIVCERAHPEKEIEIEGKPEYVTDKGQPVLALGYDNFEIIEKDDTRIQVVKIND